MQSSSRIPRRVSGGEDSVSSSTEVNKAKSNAALKISLTDQGKAAKLLRKRLAYALATNTRLTSDSSNSESDPETTGKRSKTQETGKTSIPRKISQETPKKTPEQQHLLGERNSEGNQTPDTREVGTTAESFSKNSVGNIEQENILTADNPKQREPTRFSKFSLGKNIEAVTNNNTAATLSRDPPSYDESLADIHEKATRKSEGVTSKKHGNLDVIEIELLKLKLEMNKTLADFQGMKGLTEDMKIKLEELRRDRIRAAS